MARQPKDQDIPEAKTSTAKNYSTITYHRGWLYGIVAVVGAVLIFAAGAAVANHHRGILFRTGNIIKGPGISGRFGGGGFGRFGNGGGMVNISGQTRTEGVVTSLSDSGFTLAGNGSTTNVTTNSSTQYQNGNQVKQNDTVIVLGTSSNGTLTATRIIINP